MNVKSGPSDSRYVRDRLNGNPPPAYWDTGHEESFIMVLEAHRRFQEECGDTRTAAALTLAWATHFARPE